MQDMVIAFSLILICGFIGYYYAYRVSIIKNINRPNSTKLLSWDMAGKHTLYGVMVGLVLYGIFYMVKNARTESIPVSFEKYKMI
jgi:hypothetical protein